MGRGGRGTTRPFYHYFPCCSKMPNRAPVLPRKTPIGPAPHPFFSALTFSRARCDLWSSHFLQPFAERDRCDACKDTGPLSRRGGGRALLDWTEKWGPFEEGAGWAGWKEAAGKSHREACGMPRRHGWPPACWHKEGFGLVAVYLQLPLLRQLTCQSFQCSGERCYQDEAHGNNSQLCHNASHCEVRAPGMPNGKGGGREQGVLLLQPQQGLLKSRCQLCSRSAAFAALSSQQHQLHSAMQ